MKKLLFLLLCISIWQGCSAQKAHQSEIFTTTEGAIKGYDPVAYFNESKPIKGNAQFTYLWKGAKWSFINDKNKQLFVANPEKYTPQYGGYCAYGWAKGYAAKIEPDAWSIVEGKLYLNYDKEVKAMWDKNQTGFIKSANENYQKKQLKK
jgi:YHS domain-containing protein